MHPVRVSGGFLVLAHQRRERIRQLLQARQTASVVDLSQAFSVSASTIRRDLQDLEDQGRVRREHGGAIATPTVQAMPEPPILQRAAEQSAQKERIGQAAAALVREGETVFLGSGTTTEQVAWHLRAYQSLTVLTNALNIVHILHESPGITIVLVGGLLRKTESSLVGPLTEQATKDLRADKVIIGIRAVHPQIGLTNDTLMETQTDRAIIQCAPELIVVADNTKIGRVAASFVAPVTAINILVTDADAPADVVDVLRSAGVRVELA